MKKLNPILEEILKKRLNEELRLVGSERDVSFGTLRPASKKLRLSREDDFYYSPTGSSVRIETPLTQLTEPNFSTKPNWVEPSPGEIKRSFGFQPQIAKSTKKSGRPFTSTIPEPTKPTIQTTLPVSQSDLDAALKAREGSILQSAAIEAEKEAEKARNKAAAEIEAKRIETAKAPKLKLAGTDIDLEDVYKNATEETPTWKQAYSPITSEFQVSPYGKFGSREVIQQLVHPKVLKNNSFVEKMVKKSTPAAKFVGRFGVQSTLGWPFHQAGEQFAKNIGIESPWGQYFTGWAASGAAADVLYPAVTTVPRLIAQGARPAAALSVSGAQGLAALASPLNLAITLGPLAVWGAIEAADKIEDWKETKDMTPEQKKEWKKNKDFAEYLSRYAEYERKQEKGRKSADPDIIPIEAWR